MMKKENWKLHVFMVMVLAVFVLFGLGSTASAPDSQPQQTQQQRIPQPQPSQPQQAQQPSQVQQTNPQQAQQQQIQQTTPASPYFTGNGGRGISIAILPPQVTGLANDQGYLPALIQGEFVSNFSTYSAISVLDRQRLDDQYAELFSGYYDDDNSASMDLGRLTPTTHIMGGNITRTATGYVLQMQITDTASKMTTASYSGTISFTELNNMTGIRRASIELLQRMGVTLTARARQELTREADADHVNAQTALAQGITAQQLGNDVEALSFFIKAGSYDPGLTEIENRLSIISASIASDSIGANARNDIAWRRQWLARLQETETFYRNYVNEPQPYYLLYDSNIRQGTINYQNETVELSFNMRLVPDDFWVHTINEVILTIEESLRATGRTGDWGFDWPNNVVSTPSPFTGKSNNFSVVTEVINEQGQSIGRGTVSIPYGFFVRFGITSARGLWQGTVSIPGVDVNFITDRLSIRVISIDGIPAETAARQKRITILPANEFGMLSRPGGVVATNEAFFTVNNSGVLTGYNGSQTNVVIPSIINGITVIEIGERALQSKNLISVMIPNGVRTIGNSAFSNNSQLTRVNFPNSINSIGNSAFFPGLYSASTSDFRITSVIIGANVNISNSGIGISQNNTFDAYYNRNDRKAGTYIGTRSGNNTTWTYTPPR